MVDTSLNRKYTAKQDIAGDFKIIPDGTYTVRVKEVEDWVAKTQNIKVIQRDENGKALQDEKGEKITELVNDCTFYNCNVKFEIVGGEFDGRIVFHNLTTHPNMPFSIPAFLYGIGMNELSASEIQEKTKGKMCLADVYTDSYDKQVENKETGLTETVKKEVNKLKNFKQISAENSNDEITDDLGI